MKINTIRKTAFTAVFLLTTGFFQKSIAQQKFEKSTFYNVMATGDIDAVENELSIIQNASTAHKEGYEGALIVKKAGLVKGVKTRLDLFKAGCKKLEAAILADSTNTEFHFLRLAIQEHAPGIVKYHSDIKKDKAIIQKNYNNLSPTVQHAILDYCKKSKVLHAEDL